MASSSGFIRPVPIALRAAFSIDGWCSRISGGCAQWPDDRPPLRTPVQGCGGAAEGVRSGLAAMARNSTSSRRVSRRSVRTSSRMPSSRSSKIGSAQSRSMPQTPTLNANSRSRIETRLRASQREVHHAIITRNASIRSRTAGCSVTSCENL